MSVRLLIEKGVIFICALAVSIFIFLAALNTTILNPAVVKGWLRESDVYSKVVSAFTKPADDEQLPDNTIISSETTRQALEKTFTPAYVQEHSEKVIDSVYAWLDGKSSEPTFMVPITEKKDDFITQLAGEIEPRVTALPVCTAQPSTRAEGVSCRPATVPPRDFARMIVTESVNQSGMLNKPLTQETLGEAQPVTGTENPNKPPINQLPSVIQLVRWLLLGLPVVVLLCIIILAFVAGDRLFTYRRLFRRLFFSTILTLLAAGILVYLSANPHILPGFTMAPTGGAVEIFTPVIQKAISGIASQLALLSGIVVLASGLGWLVTRILMNRRHTTPTMPPPTNDSQLPPTPGIYSR